MTYTIRPLEFQDFPQWLPLWVQNNLGEVREEVTTHTWSLLTSSDKDVHGFGAYAGDELCGILHYILHPTTGHLHPACYMQDLFTAPEYRGKGVASALLRRLIKKHNREQWARIYWVAEADNAGAQALYQHFGVKLDFTFHVHI